MMRIGYLQKLILALLISLILFPVTDLKAQNSVYLKIQSQGFRRIDLILGPFSSEMQTDLNLELRRIVENDLKLSGFFRLIEEADLIKFKQENNAQTPLLESAAKVDAVVGFEDQSVFAQVRLADYPDSNVIFHKRFYASLKGIRKLAHQISDKIIYHLVGEEGVSNTRLVFVTELEQRKELALVDYDGAGFRQLTSSQTLNLSPAWSADGKKIAFTSYSAENPNLLILNLDVGNIFTLSAAEGLNTAPAWSPDGKKIALTMTRDGNAEIYTVELKNNSLQRLTNHPAIESSPSWAPGGREIAFTSDRTGSPQIYVMDADGADVRRLSFTGNYNDSPVWSPKADRIAFVSRVEGQFHIFTMDIYGENLQQITTGPGNHEDPCWAPDGFRLAFASNREGSWDIYVINWDGTELRKITQSGKNISPSWSPRFEK
jgi:TolB protein